MDTSASRTLVRHAVIRKPTRNLTCTTAGNSSLQKKLEQLVQQAFEADCLSAFVPDGNGYTFLAHISGQGAVVLAAQPDAPAYLSVSCLPGGEVSFRVFSGLATQIGLYLGSLGGYEDRSLVAPILPEPPSSQIAAQ